MFNQIDFFGQIQWYLAKNMPLLLASCNQTDVYYNQFNGFSSVNKSIHEWQKPTILMIYLQKNKDITVEKQWFF
jgi:hypothetical protein